MKTRFGVILASLCLFLLSGCGKNIENIEANENTSSEDIEYKIVSEDLLKFTDDDGVNVYYLAEIKNTGNNVLQFNNMGTSIDIEDQDGKLLTSNKHIYTRPSILAPGESGYISEGVVYSKSEGKGLASENIGKSLLHIDVQKAEESPVPDVEITEATLNTENRISITGRAKSKEKDVLDVVHVIIPVRDENNKLCAVAIGQIENLNPGEQKGFKATDLSKYPGDSVQLSMDDVIVCGDVRMFGGAVYR